MKLKIVLEYRGDSFSGWQFQPGQKTVQGELERSLQVLFESIAKKNQLAVPESVSVSGSGRTDAGVHAYGQVASFDWPSELPFDPEQARLSLNGITDHGLNIREISLAPSGFDARRSRHTKRYKYRILLRRGGTAFHDDRAWVIYHKLNITEMVRASRLLVGDHDFSSFRSSDCSAKSPIRTIILSELVRPSKDELVFIIEGCGFLKQMIRTIVGTLVEVGQGKTTTAQFAELLHSQNRQMAGPTAPAHGLTLQTVTYH